MKSLFIIFSFICFLRPQFLLAGGTKTNSSIREYYGQSIEDILKLPEDKIDIGLASLILAKEFYPNLNIPFFLKAFDYLGDRFLYYFGKYTNPDDRIAALNTYLYRPGFWNDSVAFSYDDDDLEVAKLKNNFINGYIASKKGSCITMPLLYIIMGQKIGFPIYPVRSAKHFFARYIPEKPIKHFRENIEATNGGGFISDEQYKEDILIPERAIKNGVYLRTLTKKQYIASLLLVNADEYLRQRNIEKAKEYYLLAIVYDSTFSPAYWNYGLTAFGEARELEDKMWNEKQNYIDQNEPSINLTNQNSNVEEYPPIPNPNLQKRFQKGVTQPEPKPFSFGKLNNNDLQHDNVSTNHIIQVAELHIVLRGIEDKYKPLILKKIKIYKEYTQKAEQLGIVHEFPVKFFQKQSESIKKFKQKGCY